MGLFGVVMELTAHEIEQLKLLLVGNIDLHGRRIINAGASSSPADYVTKTELDDAIDALRQEIG